MATPETRFAKTAWATVANSANETDLLPNDNVGSATFVANSLRSGDIIMVRAWGSLRTAQNAGTLTMRLRFPAIQIIATSGATVLPNSALQVEWEFYAMVTIRIGYPTMEGYLICDGIFLSRYFTAVPLMLGIFPKNANQLQQFPFTVNQANTFQLTAQFSAASADNVLNLETCSIEYLPRP